jgi:assimilatory nitrate reductase catalytic subunit
MAATEAVRTACAYCGVGCGVIATPAESGGIDISGDPMHPANFGALCSKGMALGETLGLDGRLLHPMVRRDGALAQTDWTTALDAVATGFRRVIRQHGPDAVAFYLSGQLLTEDYYVANKLMKGFIGSANVDTNSRLCMASSVAGHRRAFGADTVPGVYADLDEADLIVLVGSNAAWCHPVLFRRMAANKRERGARLVVIDPRRTATAEDADLFLPIRPGSDTALFCGLLVHLAETGALDDAFIEDHTAGFAQAVVRAREIAPDAEATARATGLARTDVVSFFGWLRATPRTVTCYSQGVNQSAQGTDKVNAIINCHLATGRIGKPGAGPFSLTGQPNAMGGREVGGLANQLAAHMGFSPVETDRVRRFWNAPRMATHEGLKAVQMFEAIEAGRIKALWVMATNPAVSLPRAGAMRDALRKLELFVVSDNVRRNDTVEAGAHVLLPATAWGEKDGTVTNSERRITRQRAFLPAPGDAKPDWWIVCQVARRMGFGPSFRYGGVADIFREHAALSAFENEGRRDFDLGGLAGLTDPAFESLEPTQWPVRTNTVRRQRRFFADGGFFTPDRKARFISVEPPELSEAVSDEFPLRLNTGRVRDQWHTMTRSGTSPRLALHCPEPFVEIAPADAQTHGLVDGGFARITTRHGAAVLRVVVSAGQQVGSLFAPIHWSDATASCARVGDLVAPATDPHSGQPESKATPAAIASAVFASRGFALTRQPVALPISTWWARAAVVGGTGYLLATDAPVETWRRVAGSLLRQGVEPVEFAEYIDVPRGLYRVAAFAHGRLEGCLFIGPAAAVPQWDAVREMFAADALASPQRRMVLSARPPDGLTDAGPIVCSCFGVGLNVIRRALSSGAAANVDEIGKALRAGTNCGSCLPELRRIVQGSIYERVAV